MSTERVVVIGGGPAGLAAAHELVCRGEAPVLLERDPLLGGISRTERYKGYHFDIGGHRFFTRFRSIDRLWREMMGGDFLKVARTSRIYYRGRYFDYPLRAGNALANLGPVESARILLSYLKARVRPLRQADSFEEWVANRFGRRLYEVFFKTYTEKVWGIPCSEIRADWAAQRIQGLSLAAAVWNALVGGRGAKTLIAQFDYPVLGPGMMWARFREAIESGGGEVRLGADVTALRREGGAIRSVVCVDADGGTEIPVRQVVSSMPIADLVLRMEPAPPPEVTAAARGLSYRALLVVGLILRKRDLFRDQWIYVHSPDVRVGRVQNFGNWSAAMVPDPGTSSIGMEYFCTEGDGLWIMPDGELTALACRELAALGLAGPEDVADSVVFRQPGAYPIYDAGYRDRLAVLRDFIRGIRNLQTSGRNGLHRYNNMDHSMHTGILAARNALGAGHDVWAVNEENTYLEATRDERALRERLISQTFARIDKLALATACGSVAALGVFLATLWLVVKGGEVVGPRMQLLAQYFPGYTVTVRGAFLAFGYSFVWAFLFGWLFAYLRNLVLTLHLYRLKRKAALLTFRDFFDQL